MTGRERPKIPLHMKNWVNKFWSIFHLPASLLPSLPRVPATSHSNKAQKSNIKNLLISITSHHKLLAQLFMGLCLVDRRSLSFNGELLRRRASGRQLLGQAFRSWELGLVAASVTDLKPFCEIKCKTCHLKELAI
jgi:hypothetical protein